MSIITISRGTFSGGKTLAECLAGDLGYRCVDRDVIVEKAAVSGVSQKELSDALQKAPSFLDRFGHKKYTYLTLIQAALAEEVKTGKVVYHGNAGHLLLKGGGPVLRVRIIAPMEFRISMAEERLKLSRGEAIAYIRKVDQSRKKWTQYLYGVNWGDPALYDIVLNLEFFDIEEACQTIGGVVRRQRCFDYGPKCQAVMNDFALACRVKAALALNEATRHLEFEVDADGGAIAIRGRLTSPDEATAVQRVALETPGVESVNLDELVSRTEA